MHTNGIPDYKAHILSIIEVTPLSCQPWLVTAVIFISAITSSADTPDYGHLRGRNGRNVVKNIQESPQLSSKFVWFILVLKAKTEPERTINSCQDRRLVKICRPLLSIREIKADFYLFFLFPNLYEIRGGQWEEGGGPCYLQLFPPSSLTRKIRLIGRSQPGKTEPWLN